MLAGYNKTTGMIEVAYTTSCDTANHAIYYGDLANVSTHSYSGAACWRGASGTTSFDPGALADTFFVLVGNTGAIEGSYGKDGDDVERPEDMGTAGCNLPQDLTTPCDAP